MDRPQLHDIVRDFVISQHTEDGLRRIHRHLVTIMRDMRPKNVHGLCEWKNAMKDAGERYVRAHAKYHIREGWDRS